MTDPIAGYDNWKEASPPVVLRVCADKRTLYDWTCPKCNGENTAGFAGMDDCCWCGEWVEVM